MIKCGHCKSGHETIEGVRTCAKEHFTAKVKVEIGTPVPFIPAPFTALKPLALVKEIDPAKVQVGTIVEETVKPVALVVIPEHRIQPNMAKSGGDMFLENIAKLQQVANTNPGISITDGIAQAMTLPSEPVAPVMKTGQDLDLGMYQHDGIVYKIEFNKQGTHKYAKKLLITTSQVWDIDSNGWKTQPKGKFIYAYGMMAVLTSEHKMNEAQAKTFHDTTKEKYGQPYGFCCVCGKLLTVKKSIDAGIGPVCASKL